MGKQIEKILKGKRILIATGIKAFVVVIAAAAVASGVNSVIRPASQIEASTPSIVNFDREMLPVSAETINSTSPKTGSTPPVRLELPVLDVVLDISEGRYDSSTGKWNLEEDYAYFARPSKELNTLDGNTLIYAHKREGMFLDTERLKTGDSLFVTGADGRRYHYRYTGDRIVLPSDTSIFGYEGPPQVTLLTCHGYMNSHRRLMFFALESVGRE